MMDVYNLTINYRTSRKREVFCFLPQKKQKKCGWKFRNSKDCVRMMQKIIIKILLKE